MTDYTRFNPDGSRSFGTVHPEVAEASLACLKRDLRLLRHTHRKSFLRRPYLDLHEAQMIALNPGSPTSDQIVGIAVCPVIKDDTNACIPLTAEQVQREIADGKLVDLWASKGFK